MVHGRGDACVRMHPRRGCGDVAALTMPPAATLSPLAPQSSGHPRNFSSSSRVCKTSALALSYQESMLGGRDMATRNRKRFVLGGVGAFIAAGLLGTLGIAATQG